MLLLKIVYNFFLPPVLGRLHKMDRFKWFTRHQDMSRPQIPQEHDGFQMLVVQYEPKNTAAV